MKHLFLNVHKGLGDALICHGMVRKLRESFDSITLPVKPHNLPSVSWMFQDDPAIKLVPLDDIEACDYGNTFDGQVMGLGFCYFADPAHGVRCPFDHTSWDASFYHQLGMDPKVRWTHWRLPKLPPQVKVPPVNHYLFIHDDPTRDMVIKAPYGGYLEEVRPRPWDGCTIFAYCDALSHARELHCLDSCFAILADLTLEPLRSRGYFLYRKPTARTNSGPPSMRRLSWTLRDL